MTQHIFLKIILIHLFAMRLAMASTSQWALQQIEAPLSTTPTAPAALSNSSVVVAVIDTGMDLSHPALRNSVWKNPGETGVDAQGRDKASNGIDDDNNGFVDDVYGWNFVNNSNDVSDQNGHGTHIGGILQSVAPEARWMILKYYDAKATSQQNVRNSIKAFRYAIQMKARLINYSGGGPGANPEEEAVLQLAMEKDILLVAAAGNDGVNTDRIKYFPADYALPNVLAVTALNQFRKLPLYANFGSSSVHLAAPGDHIRSFLPGGILGEMSGTSQATAYVSGAAALLLAKNPDLSTAILKSRLMESAVFETTLSGKTLKASRLNVSRALRMKTSHEAAAGFVFDNESAWDPETYTLSLASLDAPSGFRQSGGERTQAP